MIQLIPIVLSAISMVANGYGNPTMAAPAPIVVQCSLPAADQDADGVTWATGTGYQLDLAQPICKKLNAFARSPKLKGDDFSNSATEMAWALRDRKSTRLNSSHA